MRYLRRRSILFAIAFSLIVIAAVIYQSVVPGLSKARGADSALEAEVATFLLHASVPAEAKARTNPLATDAAAITAGRDLFRQKCEVCHAYDGGGKTEVGAGEYPRAPALRSMNVMEMSDGEIFYHIRNGIRNTGMPAWSEPDEQLWQLVVYLRHLPIVAPLEPVVGQTADAHYVGSATCGTCHTEIFQRWKQTLMANVVRDPKERPDAIIPDLSKPDPLVTFTKGRHRLRLRQQMEAALFQENRRRLFPSSSAMGRHQQGLAKILRRAQYRLVGRTLSARQYAAADRRGSATGVTPSTMTSRPKPKRSGMSDASAATDRAARMRRSR